MVKKIQTDSKTLQIIGSIIGTILVGCEKVYHLLRFLMPATIILLAMKVGALPNHLGLSHEGF